MGAEERMSKDLVRRAVGFMKLGRPRPAWFETVAHRHPPLTFKAAVTSNNTQPKKIMPLKGLSASRPISVNRPAKIDYPEDRCMQKFFQEHPLEKYRPTAINEADPTGSSLDGFIPAEALVEKQLELMETKGMKPGKAYQVASEWFWEERKRQELTRRIAREEYLHAQEQASITDSLGSRMAGRRRTESVSDVLRKSLQGELQVLLGASQKEQM